MKDKKPRIHFICDFHLSTRLKFCVILTALICARALAFGAAPPDDFPQFKVPGHDKEMATLRELFWLHYPGAGPKATLWDEWLPDASLWPAVATGQQSDKMRRQWKDVLSARIIDSEGYVATHQHGSIAHQLGWPFPFWMQGRRGCGWHFSLKTSAPEGYRPRELSKPDGWTLLGARDAGTTEDGWQIEITNSAAVMGWHCPAANSRRACATVAATRSRPRSARRRLKRATNSA